MFCNEQSMPRLSTEPGVMHKGMREKFEHQSADADFNHDFMEQMVKDHKAAVEPRSLGGLICAFSCRSRSSSCSLR